MARTNEKKHYLPTSISFSDDTDVTPEYDADGHQTLINIAAGQSLFLMMFSLGYIQGPK